MANHILTLEGHRAPPHAFVKRLERFDPNLRVVWGLSQAVPFPGWVIERRIPGHMKAKVYAGKSDARERYADQGIIDRNGDVIGRRQFDMMPDWYPVYQVMDEDGKPITELGEFVIDYFRNPNHYARTLIGFPELGTKHFWEDFEAQAERQRKKDEAETDRIARMILDHKTEVFSDVCAFGGQPNKVKEGTQL